MDTLLLQAQSALAVGDVVQTRAFARAALEAAESRGDRGLAAHALLCLARCERHVSRMQQMCIVSQRAALAFEALDQAPGAAMAWTQLAHAACALGHDDEAEQAAQRAVQLAGALSAGPVAVAASTELGAVSLWGKRFDSAETSLQCALALARVSDPPCSPMPALLQRLWCEAVRHAATRERPDAAPPPPERLHALADACAARLDTLGALPTIERLTLQAGWHLAHGLLLSWCGELRSAGVEIDLARGWLERLRVTSWLSGVESWIRCEIACSRQSWDAAERACARMIATGQWAEHEQLARLGRRLAAQIAQRQHRDAPESAY